METDVQQTGDGQFVLVHDPVLLRYTGELLLPRDLTLAEFQRRDAGRWFSPEFAGTGFPALQDLGPLSTAHPLAAWILDLKSIGSQPQDVDALKRTVTQTFSGGATVLLAADNLGLLESLRDSGRPLALQVDVARAAFLWGDLIPPLLSWELSQLAHDYGVSQLFLISSKAGRLPELATLTDHGVNLWFWNFHDVMYSTGPW
jgi:glycerophosphoryl diester phosphodiesterase